jgi:general secretion pathway protein D
MKNSFFNTTCGGILMALFGTLLAVQAQQRTGGGGGGGFGGFGGGGFGGGLGGGNRGFGASSSTSQYNNNGQVGTATFAVDPDTHTITVVADEETAQQIQNVIDNLDRPKRQVLIKVVFLQVTHNNSLDLGVQGGWAGPAGDSKVSAANSFGLSQLNSAATTYNALGQANTTQSPSSSGNGGGFYQIIGKDYQATLQALAQSGKAEVLARPSVLARDGQLAEIVAGQSIYLPTGVNINQASGTTAATTSISGNYKNVGIQLDVTPYIGANNLVEMILVPQNTSVDTSTPGQVITTSSIFSSAIYAPNINQTSANTVVVTPDGQPVVIGGLIQDTRSASVSQVPVLGDIPVLGNLFKSTTRTKQKEELVIFITPHIVPMADELAAVSGNERTQATQFVTNGFGEQELNRFLDQLPVKKGHKLTPPPSPKNP